jgi:hypothetical protein|tara:strand:- start:28 stop:321 length:294 start_codon:yes stop_codon:yes gene_type:complete
MAYRIKRHTQTQAKKLGVSVKPSKLKGKKIDVFKGDKKVASIGALGMNDYPTYMELERNGKVPKGTAKERRRLYKIRHEKNRKKIGSAGYFSDKLLW